MKQAFIILIAVFIPLTSFTKHPVESLSVGEVSFREKSIFIKVKCLEEGLRASLNNFTNKNIVFDYDEPAFSKELLRIIESYFKSHLQVSVNNKILQLKLKNAYWVEGTQASDHAAINVEVVFPLVNPIEIKKLQIKNSLLMSVPEQINILNVNLDKTGTQMLTFKKGDEMGEINF